MWAATVPTRDDGSYYTGTTANVNATLQEVGLQRSERWSTGLVSGGDLSIAAGNQINITAGTGYIGTTRVTWGAQNGVAMLNSGDNYVAIDSNGSVNIAATKQNGDNYIVLGYVYTTGSNTAIGLISSLPYYAGNYTSRNNNFLDHSIGAIVESGNIVSETTPLALIATGGTINANLKEFSVADATTFTKWYQTADNGWVQDTANNLVNTADYNVTTNNQASALAAMTAGYWKKDLIIRTLDGHLHYVYGQAQYSTQQAAKDGPLPTTPTAIVNSGGGVYIATIVSQDGDTSIASRLFDVRPNLARVFGFGTSGTTGSVLSHSQLSGLLNDDHPQYLLTNGGRLLTGNLQMNSNAITGATNLTMAGLLQNTLTTEQMRLRYDASNYTSFTVDSTGGLTIAPSSSATTTIGSGLAVGTMLKVSGNATIAGALGVSGTATVGNLIDSGVAANSLLYANASKQLAATTISAPLSWSAGTLSIPAATASQNGYLASTDWTLFNNKMGSSTIASLTSNYIPKWNGTAFANSTIYDNGKVGIGTTTPAAKFSVQGSALFSGNLSLANLTATGTAAISGAATIGGTLAVTGHTTFEGVTSTGATGTGNLVYSTSPTLVTPNLGTPSAVTLTNATGLPIATGVSGLGAGVATFLATPSSANLAAALTDETGTGSAVFSASPTFTGTVNGAALNFSGTATVGNLIDSGVAANSLLYANASKQLAATTISAPLSWSAGTLSIPAANGSTNGYLASTDWTLFNNKMGSSTIASLTSNYVLKWNGTAFANSTIYDNGNVGIGTTSPLSKFSIQATAGSSVLNIASSTGASIIYSDQRGRVGINTSAPRGGQFDVQGLTSLTNDIGQAALHDTAPLAANIGGSLLFGGYYNATSQTEWAGITGLKENATSGQYGGYLAFRTRTNGHSGTEERMRIDSSGNVGIGTTTPWAKLSVKGSGTSTGKALAISDSANVTRMVVQDNGNVGIGTTNPGSPLEVATTRSDIAGSGAITINGTQKYSFRATSAAPANGFAIDSYNGAVWSTPFVINNTGNVGIGTTNPANTLDIGNGGGIHITSGVPASTAYALYNNAGTLTWNGIALGTGSSVSGTTGYVPKFTASNALGNSAIFQSGSNVGIGTTTPAFPLEIRSTVNGTVNIDGDTSLANNLLTFSDNRNQKGYVGLSKANGALINDVQDDFVVRSDTNLLFGAGGSTERMRITSAGNVGIGTTNPSSALEVVSTSGAASAFTKYSSTAGNDAWLAIRRARGTPASPAAIANGDYIGEISAIPYDGSTFGSTASVSFLVNGTVGAGSVPTDIAFYAGATAGGAERMRITSAGNVGIGTTTPVGRLTIKAQGGGNPDFSLIDSAGTNKVAEIWQTGLTGTGGILGLFKADGTQTVQLSSVSGAPSYINNGGNVGIGTTSPNSYLAGTHGLSIFNSATPGLGFGNSSSYWTWYMPTGSTDMRLFGGTNGVDRLTIQQGGNVGIGTTNPSSFKLQVAGNIGPDAASSYNLGSAGLNWGCLYYNSGTLGTCASDARLKTDIAPLTFSSDPEAQVDGLQPRSFAYTTAPSTTYHGLIAQEVLTVAPELVTTGSNGYYEVKYGDLQWLMLAAMQQQSAKIAQIQGVTSLMSVAALPEPPGGVAAECVTGDTKLKRRKKRGDGSYAYDEVAIADVVVGDEVLSLDEKRGRAVWRRVRALLPKGVQEVYELKTRSGRVIRTTANHPYLARVAENKI